MTSPAVLKRETRALVFDQYGTIVDMQSGLTEAAAPFLKKKGWDGEAHRFVTWWRRTHYENSMIDALCDRGHTPYREIGHRAVSYVMDRCGISYTQDDVQWLVSQIETLKPFPDVIAALDKLRAAGYGLVILSNGDRDMLEAAGPHIGAGGRLLQAALGHLRVRRGDHRGGAHEPPVCRQSCLRLHWRQELRHANRLYRSAPAAVRRNAA
jgi:2-haloalkanoic acid dehalogenase type II